MYKTTDYDYEQLSAICATELPLMRWPLGGANYIQLNCSWLPLSDPPEMSRMQSTESVLDILGGFGTITS